MRIANFSGMMGDRFTALAEVVHGEPVDVAVADYMAEITLGVVASQFAERRNLIKDFSVDYFLLQLSPLLGKLAEKSIKVVVNAGFFNPQGLAKKVRHEVARQKLGLRVAHIEGDDVLPKVDTFIKSNLLTQMNDGEKIDKKQDQLLAANAYLGGWGIAAALQHGADIVIAGRVSDASLIMGPAAWWHNWRMDEWDKLAGAVAAGHIIECGPQAVGGNFSGFKDIPNILLPGFPIAEIAEDGTSVITKRAGDGGAVNIHTVTAQLLYEIQGPRYLNPDVVLHIDSVELTQETPDRVKISHIKGSQAPQTTKVGMYYQDGFRIGINLYATGLDIEEKKSLLLRQINPLKKFLELDELLIMPLGVPAQNPRSQEEATITIRISAAAKTQEQLIKLHGVLSSLFLSSIPGFYGDVSLPNISPRVEYLAALLPQKEVEHTAVLDNGEAMRVDLSPMQCFEGQPKQQLQENAAVISSDSRSVPLGNVIYARTGDKGGDANLGIWCKNSKSWEWVRSYFTESKIREFTGQHKIERYEFPKIFGIEFVIKNHFGNSGCGNLYVDQAGKALGEYIRARYENIPEEYL